MKEFIVVDFNGALLSPRPFNETHKAWFQTMSVLLNDPSINNHAGKENYFEKVDEVMTLYLGNVNSETKTKFARQLFSMTLIAEIKKEDLSQEFVEYLQGLKEKYKIALVTSAPSTSVEPILNKLGISDLFDVIIKSEENKRPKKQELIKEFIKKHKTPLFYVGFGDKDLEFCKDLNIKTVSVNWFTESKNKGDFNVNEVSELKNIL